MTRLWRATPPFPAPLLFTHFPSPLSISITFFNTPSQCYCLNPKPSLCTTAPLRLCALCALFASVPLRLCPSAPSALLPLCASAPQQFCFSASLPLCALCTSAPAAPVVTDFSLTAPALLAASVQIRLRRLTVDCRCTGPLGCQHTSSRCRRCLSRPLSFSWTPDSRSSKI